MVPFFSGNDQKEEHQIYSCPHCPDIFVKKSHLIGHAKKYHTEQYGLIEAPGIISKHTGGKSKFLAKKSTGGSGLARKSTSGGGGSIPSAPSIIAKRPGVSSMRAQKSKKKVTQRRTDLIRESQAPPGTRYDNDDNDDDDVDYQPPESSINDIDPVPSTSSGITDADRQPQDFLPGAEDMNISASDVQEYFASLPNPLPEAPSKDSIMYRGEWISKRKYAAIKKRNAERLSNNSKPRPYNYKPFITITGTSKPDTIEEAHTGEDGHFPCMHCSATFTRERSLQVHISRSHNENMKANCPECGKGLSSTAAIKKHLLSHRPSTQWPIMCPLCGKRFQAKGDMPKHLVTKLHENDDIPPIGSSAWKELIDRSVLLPQMHLNRTGIRKGYVGAAVAAAAQDDANSEVVYETEEGSIDDPPLPPPPPRPQSEANSSTGAGEEIMVASPASSIAETKPALGVGLEMTTDQDGAPMPAPSLPPIRPIPTTTQPDQKPTVLTPPELPPATLRSSFQAPAQIQPQIQHPQQPPEQQQYEAAIQQQYQASIQQQQQYPAPIAKPEAVVPDADVAPIAPAPSSSHGASAFHPVLPAGGIVYNSDGFPVARCSHPLASPSPLPPQSANGVENETTFTMGPNGSLMPKPEDNR